jgi:hypothetical protein
MERCKYCSAEYHPMLRATKPGELIYVCEMRLIFDDKGEFDRIEPTEECKNKAVADGYTLRRDLTPGR